MKHGSRIGKTRGREENLLPRDLSVTKTRIVYTKVSRQLFNNSEAR